MPRAYWKGYLRLSLVTCPIELFPATSQAEKTHFHQINTSTGHRLRQQMVDEQTGRVVDTEHKGRGYEISKGRYVPIDDDELKAVEIESTHTVDITGFVPKAEIDKRYLDKPYYVAPAAKLGRTHLPSSVMLPFSTPADRVWADSMKAALPHSPSHCQLRPRWLRNSGQLTPEQ